MLGTLYFYLLSIGIMNHLLEVINFKIHTCLTILAYTHLSTLSPPQPPSGSWWTVLGSVPGRVWLERWRESQEAALNSLRNSLPPSVNNWVTSLLGRRVLSRRWEQTVSRHVLHSWCVHVVLPLSIGTLVSRSGITRGSFSLDVCIHLIILIIHFIIIHFIIHWWYIGFRSVLVYRLALLYNNNIVHN